jgi:hypothetical protein
MGSSPYLRDKMGQHEMETSWVPSNKEVQIVKSTAKVTVTMFWDDKDVSVIDFTQKGKVINAAAYSTLDIYEHSLNINAQDCLVQVFCFCMIMFSRTVPHQLCNPCIISAGKSLNIPHTADLEPSHFHMLPALIQNLGNHKFKDNDHMQTAFTQWLKNTGHRLLSTGNRKAHFIIS